MSFPFQPQDGLVLVRVEITGIHGNSVLRMALDTGATDTLINAQPLVAIGYDPTKAPEQVPVTTGSSVEIAPRLVVIKLSALGFDQVSFPVLCHTLPISAGIDDLLGLDFLRGRILTLDFQTGTLELK